MWSIRRFWPAQRKPFRLPADPRLTAKSYRVGLANDIGGIHLLTHYAPNCAPARSWLPVDGNGR